MIIGGCAAGSVFACAVAYCAWEWERITALFRSHRRARRRKGWLL